MTGGEDGFAGAADPRMSLAHGLEFNAVTYDRPSGPELTVLLTYAEDLFTEDDVLELVDLWRTAIGGLVAHAGTGAAGGLTPSDVPLVDLTQEQLDVIGAEHPDTVDVLPLSPLQEAFLFHNLLTEQTVDVYAVQLRIDFAGTLDPARMRAAAGHVLARHPNLRVAFRHEDLPQPVQVICADAEPSWTEVDLSTLPPDEREAEAARLAAAERTRRFDLDEPPLLRLLLVTLDEHTHRLSVTVHHILWDGWSTSIVLRELLAGYAEGARPELPDPTPYRDYLAWLADQDAEAARAAWAANLAGLGQPTYVAPDLPSADQVAHDQLRGALAPDLTAELGALAQRGGVTVNTIVQLAWALLLARLTGQDDVVFGTSVSGRPPELAGVADMVGMLTNTIPIRVRLDQGESAAALMTRLQAEQAALLPHHHLGLAEIQGQAGVGAGGRSLFDTTTMVVNYPLDAADWATPLGELTMSGFHFEDETHYPLRLAVIPGDSLRLWLGYRPDVFDEDEADDLLAQVVGTLSAMAARPDTPVRELDTTGGPAGPRYSVDRNDAG